MTDAPNSMPARIWAHPSSGKCVVSFITPSLDYNVQYIRADIADRMAEALGKIAATSHHPWSRIADTAITSYRESINDKA